MVLLWSEINCTLLKERLKSGQNYTENQPLGTPEGLISRTRLKYGRWTWNFGILHKSTWRLCVPILSEIGRHSFPSLPRTLRQMLLSCFFTISAEIWSLNGKATRIVSSAFRDGDKGCCWSQTFESTKLLMVELTRCLGYFNRENTVFKRSHSSEKCIQDKDKRCARSSIVLSKPFL